MKKLEEVAKQEQPFFSAALSNPPYQQVNEQREGAEEKNVRNIFHLFQEIGLQVARHTSFIYPGERWFHGSGKGLKAFQEAQLSSPTLRALTYFPPTFIPFGRRVSIADGVTLVHHGPSKHEATWTLTLMTESKPLKKIMQTGEEAPTLDLWAFSILEKTSTSPTLASLRHPMKAFNLDSNFVETHPQALLPLTSPPPEEEKDKWIRLLTNDKGGKGGRIAWFWCKREFLSQGHELLPLWKVVISSANPTGRNGHSPQVALLPPGTAFSRTRLCIAAFPTQEEGLNFLKWYGTPLVRFLLTTSGDLINSFGKHVPLPPTFASGGGAPWDYSLSSEELEEALLKHYGLEEEEKSHMGAVVAHLAPLTNEKSAAMHLPL